MSKTTLYLDHAATTPLAPEVARAMRPWLDCANPSSLHTPGRKSRAAIDSAREIVSQALGCEFGEVVFNSGGTEGANHAILGTALSNSDSRRNRILLGAAEHHCVLHTQATLKRLGYQVEFVPVDRYARVTVEALADRLGEDVLLVSVMHANNELGTVLDVPNLVAAVRPFGAIFHVDAVQTFLSLPWQVEVLGADLVSVSAHKVNGPKGVGALYIRGGTKPAPWLVGGGQEREQRAGTENVAGIVGLGAACRLSRQDPAAARDAFERSVDFIVPSLPQEVPRLPGHSHFRVPGIEAETLLIVLDRLGLAASSGAACSSGALEPSHVLLACGYSSTEAKEGVRFSFGHSSPLHVGEDAAKILAEGVESVRKRQRMRT